MRRVAFTFDVSTPDFAQFLVQEKIWNGQLFTGDFDIDLPCPSALKYFASRGKIAER